jgi:hypothetical protein
MVGVINEQPPQIRIRVRPFLVQTFDQEVVFNGKHQWLNRSKADFRPKTVRIGVSIEVF